MSIKSSAPGKLMLLGEYSALFGHRALVAAINVKASCSFSPSDRLSFLSVMADKKPLEDPHHPLFSSVLKALADNDLAVAVGTYLLDSSDFFHGYHKLGLGSSSAATVALAKAILKAQGIENDDLLWHISLKAHLLQNRGLGSGADICAAVYNNAFVFSRTEQGLEKKPLLHLAPRWHELSCIFTNKSQSTSDLVAPVLKLEQTDPAFIKDFCRRSDAICDAFVLALEHDGCFIEAIDQAHQLLKELGTRAHIPIISPEHLAIYDCAKAVGGSAKPSGAGGGDMAIAVVPTTAKAAFRAELLRRGFALWQLSIQA